MPSCMIDWEESMPKGYIYAELEVTDPALFETYRPLAAA